MNLTFDANLLLGLQFGGSLGLLVGIVLGVILSFTQTRKRHLLVVQTFLAENTRSGGKALEAVIAKDFLEKGPYFRALEEQKWKGRG